MFLFIFEQNPRESNNKGDTCSLTWLCRIPSTLDSNWVSQRTFLVNRLRHQSLCSTSKMMASRSSYIHKAFAVKHCWNWLQSKMLCTIVDSFCTGVTSVVAWRFFTPWTNCCHLVLRRKRQRTLNKPKLVIARVVSYSLSFAVHNCNFI